MMTMCTTRTEGVQRTFKTITKTDLTELGLSHCIARTYVLNPSKTNMSEALAEAKKQSEDLQQPVALVFKGLVVSDGVYGLIGVSRLAGSSIFIGWVVPDYITVLDLSTGKYPLLAFPHVGHVLPSNATGYPKPLTVVNTLPAPLKSGLYDHNNRILLCREA